MTREEALAFTDQATTHMLRYVLYFEPVPRRLATLVHDALAFSRGMSPEQVDIIYTHFYELYCMMCAQSNVCPHHMSAEKWESLLDILNDD